MNGLNDIVGQDAKEAGKWFSRDNLLINAYWGNKASIVNQQGKDEYVGKGYTIDGWAQNASPAENGIVRVTDSGLQFVATGDNIRFYWLQRFDESLKAELSGETVTASVLTTTDLYSFTVKLPSDISQYDSYTAGHYASFDGFVFDIYHGASRFWSRTIDATSTVRAAKLEKGIGQTLAHSENGVWVQNRRPDPRLELLKCQSFYLPLSLNSDFAGVNWGNGMYFFVPTPVQMRANPILRPTQAAMVYHNGGATRVEISDFNTTTTSVSNGVQIFVKSKEEIPIGNCVLAELQGAFDARL